MEGNWKSNGIRIPMSRDNAKQGFVSSRGNGGSYVEFQISDPRPEIKMVPRRIYLNLTTIRATMKFHYRSP